MEDILEIQYTTSKSLYQIGYIYDHVYENLGLSFELDYINVIDLNPMYRSLPFFDRFGLDYYSGGMTLDNFLKWGATEHEGLLCVLTSNLYESRLSEQLIRNSEKIYFLSYGLIDKVIKACLFEINKLIRFWGSKLESYKLLERALLELFLTCENVNAIMNDNLGMETEIAFLENTWPEVKLLSKIELQKYLNDYMSKNNPLLNPKFNIPKQPDYEAINDLYLHAARWVFI